jgi:hypothetical protein
VTKTDRTGRDGVHNDSRHITVAEQTTALREREEIQKEFSGPREKQGPRRTKEI